MFASTICAYPLSALRAPLRKLDAFAPPRRARPGGSHNRRPPTASNGAFPLRSSRVKHRLPARAGSLSHGLCVQERLQKLVLQRDSLPQRLPLPPARGVAASCHVEARSRLQLQVYLLRQRQCRADMHASQLCAAAGVAGRRCQVGGTANRVGRGESGGTQVHLHGRNGRKVPEGLESVCLSNRWLSILFWTASTQLAKYKVAGPVDSHVPVYNCLPTVCNCLRLSTEGRCYLHLSTRCR